jgi:hypothetical protein
MAQIRSQALAEEPDRGGVLTRISRSRTGSRNRGTSRHVKVCGLNVFNGRGE